MNEIEGYNFPRQKLARSAKNKTWGKNMIDSIIKLSRVYNNQSQPYVTNKKVNYDLYNGIINNSDFTYVTNPYGLDKNFPAKFTHYDIISAKIKLLEGEEIKRPFNFRAVAIDSESMSRFEQKEKEMIMQYMEAEFMAELQKQGIEITEEIQQQFQSLDEVKKYMTYDYSDIVEEFANHALRYLLKEQNLIYKFNKGWKDALIAGEEIYWVGIINGEPIVEVVNPLEFDYDKDPDLDFVEDGQWALQIKWCTPSSVIDTYYEDLSDEDVRKIDAGNAGHMNSTLDISHPGSDVNYQRLKGVVLPLNNSVVNQRNRSYNGYIRVVRCEWKSLRKIGFLTYFDENMEEQEMIVDETYVVKKELSEKVEWKWVSEVWEGTRIADDIYVNIQPKINFMQSIDNPFKCKLGFIGLAYSSRNSISTSLVDTLKPIQYLYNIIMYRMELEIAKAKGKKMVMDIAQIPRSQNIDMEKWLYYFDSMGLAFINSFEEGKGKFAGQTPNFNQYSSIDMSLSQSVGQYLEILSKLEQMVGDISGVSKQREGSISSYETVGNVERAVVQSSHITEKHFYEHNQIKKNVLTYLIECAKTAWEKSKKIQYIMDDAQRVLINIDAEIFSNADFGVYMTDSAKDMKVLDDLKGLAQIALQSNRAKLSDMVTILKSESITEVENKILQSEQQMMEEQNAMAKQQNETNSQAEQARLQFEYEKMDREDQNKELDRQNKIDVAQITSFIGQADQDIDDNGVPDQLEIAKLVQQDRMQDKEFKHEKDMKSIDIKEAEKDRAAKLREARIKKAQTNKK